MSKRTTTSYRQDSLKKLKFDESSDKVLITLINLSCDEFTYIVQFLEIGDVIMLSLVCKSINSTLVEFVQKLHPYIVVMDEKNNHWSLARALKTHRLVMVSSALSDLSYKCVESIFEKIVDRNEPLDKLSTRFKIRNVKFDVAFNLLSKPTSQSIENVICKRFSAITSECLETINVSFKKAPIGFQITELELFIALQISELYKLLSQCRSLERLSLYILPYFSYEQVIEDENYLIAIPMLESLKYLRLMDCFDRHIGNQATFAILRLTPNLEYLEIRYFEPIDDEFITFLTKNCPKLKGLHVESNDDNVPVEIQVTDTGILRLFEGEPNLEYLSLSPCTEISGSFCSNIGKLNHLRYLNIERTAYENQLTPQATSISFPEGSLEKLEVFKFGHLSFSVLDGELFMDTFLNAAPNIKNINGIINQQTCGVDLSKYYDRLCPKLTVFPEIPTQNLNLNNLWLQQSRILEQVYMYDFRNLGVDLFKLQPLPSVKTLIVSLINSDELKELCRVFPQVIEFNYFTASRAVIRTLEELLREGAWPNLRIMNRNCISKEIIVERPLIYSKAIRIQTELVNCCKISHNEILNFEKEWIILDKVLLENMKSEMMIFLNL